MVPRGRTEPGHFGVLASVGLGVCARESLVAPPWRMDGLAICPRGVPTPLWGPGSGDGSGLQGEGAGRKEAVGVEAGVRLGLPFIVVILCLFPWIPAVLGQSK